VVRPDPRPLDPAQHDRYCAFCAGRLLDTTPEIARLVRDADGWHEIRGLTAEQLGTHQGATYALFELEFGVRMVRAEEKIRAVAADAQQAAALALPAGAPLLSVERLSFTYNDAPMELRRGLYRTDTHHYRNELS
jgi:DNA-binding GntR family transcriptional regulator